MSAVTSGVSKFEGAIFTLWYAHAQGPKGYREGKNRFLKARAKLDERKLRKQVA